MPAIALLSLLVWGAVSLPQPVRALGYVVSNLGDNGGVDPAPNAGTGTLRQAVIDANSNPGADTITFTTTGTISLSASLPAISDALTISGPGTSQLKVDGSNLYRPFFINIHVVVTIDSITIQNGLAASETGGGIFSDGGTLTVSNSVLTGNSAGLGGGISNSFGRLDIVNSTFSDNHSTLATFSFGGGGIFSNTGNVTISDSTFSTNSAVSVGGGIETSGGTISVTSSTFSGNTATLGAGIYNIDGTITLNSSIISDNTATDGGAIYNSSGSTSATGSCITGNSATAVVSSTGTVTATGNWWGASDGPGPVGPGSGDTVSAGVDFSGFLSAPPSGLTCDGVVLPSVSVNDANVVEGNTPDTTTMTFTITLSAANSSGSDITVDYTTSGGNATAGTDYVSANGTAHIAPGADQTTISITVNGDDNVEGDETFDLVLSNPSGALLNDDTGTGTITDDDTALINVMPTSGLVTTEAGGTATFTVVLSSQPSAPVMIAVSSGDTTEGTVNPTLLTFTDVNWNAAQTVIVTGVDDADVDGDQPYTIITGAAVSADLNYSGFDPADVNVTNTEDDVAPATHVVISPLTLYINEESAPTPYTIQLTSDPSAPVMISVAFDAGQVTLNGSSTSPLILTFTDTTPQAVTVDVIENGAANTDRNTTITHTTLATSAPEYVGTLLPNVTVVIAEVPPPPPTPLCEDHNFDEGGVVRSSTSDALGYAINCRVMYQNGAPTQWLGSDLYNGGSIGVEGIFSLGVQQAIDIFSPVGQNYFQGGAVFCLKGSGTLIWLAASQSPRHPEIIGSYPVPEFPGFTCATLFEPGTLVLVTQTPGS